MTTRPTLTRAALVLLALAGCGGTVPADTRVGEADPVTLSMETLPPTREEVEVPADVPLAVLAADTPANPASDPPPPPGIDIRVRPGENLVGLASVSGVSVEDIIEINDLDPLDPLVPGMALRLPLTGDAVHAFHETRDFARAGRLDQYLAGRGGLVGVESHRVQTGETAWGIAREQAGIPTWVLAAFNPDTDLDHLGIGQRVKLPVFADSLASAEPVEGEGAGVDAATPAVVEAPEE